VVGGGKFANGAQTGAFRYLFNDSADHFFAQGNHDEIIGSEVNENALAENFCAVPLFKTLLS
jgi:UDP-2,3-diacylglucosamine pyrophosphatase LpxH